MTRVKVSVLAMVASLAMAAPASAQSIVGLDVLRTWNLVVLGDLTSSSEVEGRTFVGGNLNGSSSNYQIRTPEPSPYNVTGLTVVGDVNGSHKNLNGGSGAVVGGNVNSGFNLNGAPQTVKVGGTIANTNVNQNTVTSGLAASDPSFLVNLKQQGSLIASSMGELSRTFGGMASNSNLTISGNRGTFDAKPDAQDVAVFNISSTDLDRIGEIKFNLNGADTAIVNVTGANVTLNDNFLGGTTGLGKHVIWNLVDAQKVDATTAWGGSVLAPGAAATTGNYIEGSAVFGSLVQNGEFHLGTYVGTYNPPVGPPPVDGGGSPTPIPGEAAGLFALGAIGLWMMRRRRPAAA